MNKLSIMLVDTDERYLMPVSYTHLKEDLFALGFNRVSEHRGL